MADKSQGKSRYEQVKELLNAAQGKTNPSYQGQGRFWELPLAQFLQVKLYGIAMIAETGPADFCSDQMAAPSGGCCESEPVAPPPPAPSGHSCCGSDEGGGAPAPGRSPGRGAASGLIKGLKGEFPFDGTQFPPLLWGGTRSSSSDIGFIESWIDDGCPETDEAAEAVTADAAGTAPAAASSPAQVSPSLKMALAQGHAEHPLSNLSINQFNGETGKTKARKNIECLSPDELARLRHVIKVMRCYDAYNQYDQRSFRYWADIHANNCQHGWEQFLTWHRMYLYYFEQQMQDIDPTVTLPYWDWPLYREDVLASIEAMKVKTSYDNGTVPRAYRCFVDDGTLNELKGKIPDDYWMKLKAIEGETFSSGNRLFIGAKIAYGEKQWDDLIMAALQNTNPLWDRNRWPGGNQGLIFEAYPTPEDVQRILKIPSFFNFGSGPSSNHFFGALENIHNLIHNFSGGANPNWGKPGEPQYGDMVSAGITARDPIFWGHHSNVDRLWAIWQGMHPGNGPDDPTDVLAPWPNTVQDVETISDLGYEYLKSSYVYETDPSVSITRFKSAATEVHPAVLAKHSNAEIRLHKVQYSTAGGAFIRVFLNDPHANADTPTQGNDNFVAQVATFSGDCIGGPGHCNVPPETKRKYDLRPRHRKTPGNFRINATETVQKLTDAGATDFQINLVVLDIDGTPKSNAMWMDGVSLNFKD